IIAVEYRRWPPRHDRPQQALSLQQRQVPEVAAIEPQQIEGVEVLQTATPHQVIEERLAVAAEVHNLAVKNSLVMHRCADGCAEFWKCLEYVPVPRDEATLPGFDVGQGAKPVVLQLENPVLMVE